MKAMCVRILGLVFSISLTLFPVVALAADGWDPSSQAPNVDSIANTRHNLTVSYSSQSLFMDLARNNYGRICVYCHTPHGSNSTLPNAPLWNRTNQVAMGTTYTTFTDPTSGRDLLSGQSATAPGVSSITCLSCHDGTVAIDSIINMPGSGGYNQAQETSVDITFLNTWSNPSGTNALHMQLGPGQTADKCTFCHQGTVAPDFNLFTIGTDLTNDHPIGIQMPNAVLYGFNEPTAVDGNKWFFDANADGRADRDEIRLYDTGDGYEVECATCHDPHGVVAGGGTTGPLIPTFLRVDNDASSVCLTCHIK